jgi:hypothetical protein
VRLRNGVGIRTRTGMEVSFGGGIRRYFVYLTLALE